MSQDSILIIEKEGSQEPIALSWTSIDLDTQKRIMELTDAFMQREINPLLRDARIRPFSEGPKPYARPVEKGVSLNLRVPVEIMDAVDSMVRDGTYLTRAHAVRELLSKAVGRSGST
jgi:hypothetical protein